MPNPRTFCDHRRTIIHDRCDHCGCTVSLMCSFCEAVFHVADHAEDCPYRQEE